jgi:hypothetical protein
MNKNATEYPEAIKRARAYLLDCLRGDPMPDREVVERAVEQIVESLPPYDLDDKEIIMTADDHKANFVATLECSEEADSDTLQYWHKTFTLHGNETVAEIWARACSPAAMNPALIDRVVIVKAEALPGQVT